MNHCELEMPLPSTAVLKPDYPTTVTLETTTADATRRCHPTSAGNWSRRCLAEVAWGAWECDKDWESEQVQKNLENGTSIDQQDEISLGFFVDQRVKPEGLH